MVDILGRQHAAEARGTRSAPILATRGVTISYGDSTAIRDITLEIPEQKITAIIGPSGCGKSTLLRSFNRMNDLIPSVHHTGEILYHGQDIYARGVDPVELRRQIGMVFQKPNPFPKSILKNVTWAPALHGYRGSLMQLAEESLQRVALWDEVKDRLSQSAMGLSGGQQQRLCIARAIAMQPDVLLMDEPCSALDPVSTSRIEDLLFELKSRFTILIVTHNMQQASRVSDYTVFLDRGSMVEFDVTDKIFTQPGEQRTADYVMGRFG
ncbi:MAG: phosphate ABC transporter ATP-binding protein [Planctomycetes bacterium]|nr:phosphate ABC transporter ATP-binding protein [Planctomycetota bacterium]MCB9869198.1 phosphate ABC transporter ATP-binding protein [Planctomycetota bacterium]